MRSFVWLHRLALASVLVVAGAVSASALSAQTRRGPVAKPSPRDQDKASEPRADRGKNAVREPLTIAEKSGFEKTSLYADCVAFCDALAKLPHAKRLRRHNFGKSHEGRDLFVVTVSKDPLPEDEGERRKAVLASGKLRLLVNANIHAGEVEGKEVALMLLRELAYGEHEDLLEHAILMFVPLYNADGNERIDKRNRATQNGPGGGVGIRPQAQGYDLNRDFVKVDTPECRGLHSLFKAYDPHVFMDLHTTNGSYHGYHLTYAPSLSTNVDPLLAQFSRQRFLPEIRAAVAKHGFRIYDYGNFRRRRPENGWATYDHRPRFGTNYYGLRNRIPVLSEAYSYVSFEKRVRVTHAFVLETLRAAVRNRHRVVELCKAADERAARGGIEFGYETKLETPWKDKVLVGSVTRERIPGAGIRMIASEEYEERELPVQTAFESHARIALPRGWAIIEPSKRVLELLEIHGIKTKRLEHEDITRAEVFVPTQVRRRRRAFQKHYEVTLRGDFVAREVTLPSGTLLIPAQQRLARVAAQLLEARSEDSLATWNVFDKELEKPEGGKQPDYPVLRIIGKLTALAGG